MFIPNSIVDVIYDSILMGSECLKELTRLHSIKELIKIVSSDL